jgi:hypothetical protein
MGRRLVSEYSLVGTAVGAAIALLLGAGIGAAPRDTALVCIAVIGGYLLLRAPAIGFVAEFFIAAVLGNFGAHVLVGPLPLLELLLTLSSMAALARAVTLPGVRVRSGALIWLLPAIWGLVELGTRNRGNTVSGLREALIFIYPALFALPVMATSESQVRNWLSRYGYLVCAAGWIVLIIGVFDAVTHHYTVTDTGQLRELGGWYAEALVAAVFMSLWLYQSKRLSVTRTLVLAVPVAGLLFVNSRSAYLGVIIAGAAFALMRIGPRRPSGGANWRGLGAIAAVAGCLVAIVIIATPQGRAGVARFSTIAAADSPNIQDRLSRTHDALPTSTTGWLVGDGVGLVQASLTGDLTRSVAVTNANETHNSFATMLHLGGILGLALVLIPTLLVLIRAVTQARDPLVQALIAFIVFTLVMTAFNVVLENAYFGCWLWVPLLALQAMTVAPRRVASTVRL